jgi:hypothetical protein
MKFTPYVCLVGFGINGIEQGCTYSVYKVTVAAEVLYCSDRVCRLSA